MICTAMYDLYMDCAVGVHDSSKPWSREKVHEEEGQVTGVSCHGAHAKLGLRALISLSGRRRTLTCLT